MLLTILLVLLSFPARAEWSAPALTKIREINEKYKTAGDGEVLTAWGGWKRYRLISPTLNGKLMSFPTKETKAGSVQAYFYEHPVKRPVPFIIYFPGIFGHPADQIVKDTIAKLEAFEAHVLVIPNFLSETWLRSEPIYDRHPAVTEIMLAKAIWRDVVKIVPPSRMTELHVIGESLGTMLASAFSVQAEFGAHFPNTLTLLWPPAKLDVAMKNLDSYIVRAEKNTCSDFLTFPLFVGFFMLAETPGSIPGDFGKCLASWGARKGFMKNLHSISALMTRQAGSKLLKPRSFQEFFETLHRPFWNLISTDDETVNLGYWLGLLKQNKPKANLRIMTSFDDFLNQGTPLTEVARKAGYSMKDVYTFDWGGHGAPMGVDEFAEVLKLEYDKPASN